MLFSYFLVCCWLSLEVTILPILAAREVGSRKYIASEKVFVWLGLKDTSLFWKKCVIYIGGCSLH